MLKSNFRNLQRHARLSVLPTVTAHLSSAARAARSISLWEVTPTSFEERPNFHVDPSLAGIAPAATSVYA
jgi:hypothetical protein